MSRSASPALDDETERFKELVPTPRELEAQQKIEDASAEKASCDEDSLHVGTASNFVVDWDGPNDPANPMNWSKSKRISQVVLVSAITMVTFVFPAESCSFPQTLLTSI
jgi:hypothetical protein